ncbi:MAG: hypothetical protein IIY54_02825, partial [Ruminococcus sp.]|nr:hypothetical protein [Ruminococcus sp.]
NQRYKDSRHHRQCATFSSGEGFDKTSDVVFNGKAAHKQKPFQNRNSEREPQTPDILPRPETQEMTSLAHNSERAK